MTADGVKPRREQAAATAGQPAEVVAGGLAGACQGLFFVNKAGTRGDDFLRDELGDVPKAAKQCGSAAAQGGVGANST
jgi:hypothetical protein